MTVKQLQELLDLKCLSEGSEDRELEGGFCGDLLSWVMGKASSGDAWITIMSNVNVLAVASLTDVSCVILAEGVVLENDIVNTAREKGINIISSPLSIYEISVELNKHI